MKKLSRRRLAVALDRLEELGLNHIYSDYGVPEYHAAPGLGERVRDFAYYVARVLIRRGKALASILRVDDDLQPGDDWESRVWFLGHFGKAILCALAVPERPIEGHDWITVGAFNGKTLYAGWSADFVLIDAGWRSWRWQIENDCDWNM